MPIVNLCNCCGGKSTCDDVLWTGYIQVGVAGYDYEDNDAVNVPSYFSDVGQAPPGQDDYTTNPDRGLSLDFDGYSFGNINGTPNVFAPHPRDTNLVQKLLGFIPIIDPRGTTVVQSGPNQGKLTGNTFAYPPGEYRMAYCRGAFTWDSNDGSPPLFSVAASLFRSGTGHGSPVDYPLYRGWDIPTSKLVYNIGQVNGGSWFLVPEDTGNPLQQFSAGGLGNADTVDVPPLWDGSIPPGPGMGFTRQYRSLEQFEQAMRGLQSAQTPIKLSSPVEPDTDTGAFPIDFTHIAGGIAWWFVDNPYTDNLRLDRSPVWILLYKGTEEDYLRLLNPQP